MDILRAKEIALAAWPENMAAKFFLITNDEKCFTTPADAVAHAVHLSPGNPEVMTVNVDELELPEVDQLHVVTNETITNTRLAAMNALEIKINDLAAEIIKLDNADEINEENMAAKMHVAQLKEQLKDAANAYTEFDPTGTDHFTAPVLNLVGQLLQPKQIAPAPEDNIKTAVLDVVSNLINAAEIIKPEEIIAPAVDEVGASKLDVTVKGKTPNEATPKIKK